MDIDSVDFALGGLKLEAAGIDNTVDWTLSESVVLPLNLGGTPVLAFDTDFPDGIYKALEISIDKLDVSDWFAGTGGMLHPNDPNTTWEFGSASHEYASGGDCSEEQLNLVRSS